MNWRYSLLHLGMLLSGSPILGFLREFRSFQWKNEQQLRLIQEQRLVNLLLHAWNTTDYYHGVLEKAEVVRNGNVFLENFNKIPILTKDIIAGNQDQLKSKKQMHGRKPYKNSSGGSTGQPTVLWQDSYYWNNNIASKIYGFELLGKQMGESELKIWGSEKDLFENTLGLKAKVSNFIYNRKFEQCFKLTVPRIQEIIQHINTYQPKLIWSYRDGIDEVAHYIIENNIPMHSPAAIVVGGGTIYQHIVDALEKAFASPVINFYGSREMGAVAIQCLERKGLHLFPQVHKVEILDKNNNPIVGKDGQIIITSLTNYTMPMIRYQIGDTGKLSNKSCACGLGYPILESVSGRLMERFTNAHGDYIDPIYFIHLIGVVYNSSFIKKFQVIQKKADHIVLKIVQDERADTNMVEADLRNIQEKIKLVMGNECLIDIEFVESIPLTKSGKHLYVINEFKSNKKVKEQQFNLSYS